jgi:glycosyltransferase involved in cell wall biosynthesis
LNYSVSIVIPSRNEEKYIETCVNSLLSSNYPSHLISIYVCDGLSDDNTREIVEQISKHHKQVYLIDNEKQTTPFALNLGLKRSDADVKIILGAHSEVNPEFISENVKALSLDSEIGCSGGVLENVYEDSTSKIIGLAMSSPFGVGNAHFRTGVKAGYVDTVAFGAYKKEVFEQVGYFDESLARNQDDEFNYRLIKAGIKIYLSPKIKCKYFVRGTFKKLFKQYYQYGYWKVLVNKKHKSITTIRQLVPMLFVLFILFGGVLSIFSPWIFTAFLFGLIIYIFEAFWFANKFKLSFLNKLKVIYTFFILHSSYGIGYIKGIWIFLLLGKGPGQRDAELSR